MFARFASRFLSAFILATLAALPAWAQFDDLAAKVPSSANAVFLVNAEKILASPAAEKGNWKEKVQEAYAAGITILPPDASQAIMSAELDLESTHTLWESVVMRVNRPVSMTKVASMTKGTAGEIEGTPAVALPGDAYVVRFEKNVAAAMAPANRQAIARWLREVNARTKPALSSYLTEAFAYANELGTPIILAIDLDNAVSIEHIRLALATAEHETGKKFEAETGLSIDRVAEFLVTTRGVTLGITLAEQPFGKIKVDFRTDVPFKPEVAKKLLIHALNRRGAMIDELEEWTPKVNGKQFTLEGHLGRSGMRRIFSLFDRPPTLPKEGDDSTAQQSSDPELAATKTYFTNMQEMLDDLAAKPKMASNYTVGQKAVWYKTYARKIERLPVLNVDPDLVQFSSHVSQQLYSAADAITSGAARSRTRQVNAAPTYNYYTNTSVYGYSYRSNDYYSGYVPYGASSVTAVEDVNAEFNNRARIRTEERVASMNQARTITEALDRDVSDMRKKLTQKYKAEF
jgi:hypothetical protein